MNQFRFQLEKYTGGMSRYTCPKCKQKGEFTRYIDIETNKYISDIVGICNRKDKCGYLFTPGDYFKTNNTDQSRVLTNTFNTTNTVNTFDTIPYDKISKTLDPDLALTKNNFIKYLINIFGIDLSKELINKFRIGTAKNGYTVFYQFDTEGNIRTGKKILYNSNTGKRKEDIRFIHKTFDMNYKLNQCLFGLNQLQDINKDIAIFESEKTAIIMSVYFQDLICLATGGSENFNIDKINILKQMNCKSIMIYPDKSCLINGMKRQKIFQKDFILKLSYQEY